MKKILLFVTMAAVLGFTACSKNEPVQTGKAGNGMVLRATVEQPADTKATFTDNAGIWHFDFAEGDVISVTNTEIGTYCSFTNSGTKFTSEDAEITVSDATWYAYFPSKEISLTGQSGTFADVAGKFALAGATASPTTGKDGLDITLVPNVAVLVINNYLGEININVKNGASTWVKGLSANNGSFTVTTGSTRQDLLHAASNGTYYIAVPAGVQLAVRNSDKTIKSTGSTGLVAGKYYNLTLAPVSTGYTERTGGVSVKWMQLWDGGPKFAEYNIGAENNKPEDYGSYFNWADNIATVQWGSNWRMPTKDEFQALLANCSVSWTSVGGVNGRKYTGRGAYADNSLFLPAAGYQFFGPRFVGTNGYYWTSLSYNDTEAYSLFFDSGYQSMGNYDYYSSDQPKSVRAVLN